MANPLQDFYNLITWPTRQVIRHAPDAARFAWHQATDPNSAANRYDPIFGTERRILDATGAGSWRPGLPGFLSGPPAPSHLSNQPPAYAGELANYLHQQTPVEFLGPQIAEVLKQRAGYGPPDSYQYQPANPAAPSPTPPAAPAPPPNPLPPVPTPMPAPMNGTGAPAPWQAQPGTPDGLSVEQILDLILQGVPPEQRDGFRQNLLQMLGR